MPVNNKVDGCTGQFTPDPEDYFKYYPEMRLKIDKRYIEYEINTNDQMSEAYQRFCDTKWENLTTEDAVKFYAQFLHTTLCVKYLGINPRTGLAIR